MHQAEGSNHEYHLHHCVLILLRAVVPNAHALVWLLNYHQASCIFSLVFLGQIFHFKKFFVLFVCFSLPLNRPPVADVSTTTLENSSIFITNIKARDPLRGK